MKRTLLGCVAGLFLLIPITVQSQSACSFSAKHFQRIQQDTSYKSGYRAFEQNMRNGLSLNVAAKSKQIYSIPVVVHVLHVGEAIGTGSNISDAQIQAALASANDRFRGVNGIGTDTEIEFVLAKQDPNGCPTTGIIRVNASSIPNYTNKGISFMNSCGAADEYLLKDLSKWNTYYYYNIWIVNLIDCSNVNASGYATPPVGTPYDGAVILASAMNSLSPALTHNLGHGFGLWDTFEGDFGNITCPANANCTTDGDQICDTPPHKQGDCGSTNPCTASGNWDNSRFNYMSFCGQPDRFTSDQKARMRASFVGFPRSLLLISSGALPSNFSSSILKTNVSCFGACDGSVSITPGCPSVYTYSWSNGNTSNTLTNLCAGNYSLAIQDSAGFLVNIPIQIEEPALINSGAVVTDKSCYGINDGSVDLNVTGGVPFSCGANFIIGIGTGTVVSSNTQYPAPFGNYKMGAKNQIFFHQSELLSTGFRGGEIKSVALNVASVSGSSVYRNFQIQMKTIPNVGSLTVMQSGLKNVFSAQSISITPGWNTFYFNSPIHWDGLSSVLLQFCFNDSVSTFNSPVFSTTTSFKSVVFVAKDSIGVCNLVPSNAISSFRRPNVRFGVCNDSLNYQYLWSNGQTGNSINGLATGPYSVTIRDANGCFSTNNFQINQRFAQANAGNDVTINLGDSVDLGGNPSAFGQAPFLYTWTPNQGLSASNVANPKASPAVTTSYFLVVTDTAGCTSVDTVTVFVNTNTGYQQHNSSNSDIDVAFHSGLLKVHASHVDEGSYNLSVYNLLGKICRTQSLSTINSTLTSEQNISELPQGLYFVVLSGDKRQYTYKFVKKD